MITLHVFIVDPFLQQEQGFPRIILFICCPVTMYQWTWRMWRWLFELSACTQCPILHSSFSFVKICFQLGDYHGQLALQSPLMSRVPRPLPVPLAYPQIVSLLTCANLSYNIANMAPSARSDTRSFAFFWLCIFQTAFFPIEDLLELPEVFALDAAHSFCSPVRGLIFIILHDSRLHPASVRALAPPVAGPFLGFSFFLHFL